MIAWMEQQHAKENKIAAEYNRTGKVEGYEVEEIRGCLTLYPIDPNLDELSIMIDGGYDYDW
jgi:hypothetical protein